MLSLSRRAATVSTILAIFAASSCASAPVEGPPAIPDARSETTVYLVRHAEKMSETERDPDLSERGRARADSLAVQLRDSGVNLIITTDLKRTMQTAAPLARDRHITPIVVAVAGGTEAHVTAVADSVRAHPGATVLIVGHSNTIGKIAEKLGAGKFDDVCNEEYSNMIIISIVRGQPVRSLVESYGQDDPAATGSCVQLRDRKE